LLPQILPLIGNIINDERTNLLFINHHKRDSDTDELVHPHNGFRFSVTSMPAEGLERISRLSGILEVQVPTQVIVIDGVQSLINSQIKHPELDVLDGFSPKPTGSHSGDRCDWGRHHHSKYR